jgi:hypothetical protein
MRWLALLPWLWAATLAAAQPLLPYAEAVAARFPAPAVRYDTPGLEPGRTTATSNDELRLALQAIVDRGAARRIDLGTTSTGQPLTALHYSRGAGRPVALLIGQQHGNEPAGAEALLVVARHLATPDHPLAAVLDRLDVVVLPRANPDGALIDRRANAAGLDVNRDHLLLRTPEARAIATLEREFRPALVVDAHEHVALGRYMPKFGAIKRHDLLVQHGTTPNLPPALAAASQAWFLDPLYEALGREGLTSDWYHTNPTAADDRRLSMGGVLPDLARNAGALRHAVSILLETRGFDLGRLHLERRVHTHVVAIDSLLHSAALHAAELAQLREDAELAVAARACRGDVVLEAALTSERRQVLMLDPLTGADKAVEVDWESALRMRPLATRARPCGYWLAAGAAQAVERLRALGLQVTTLDGERTMGVERYRETARGEGARSDVLGRVQDPNRLLRVAVSLERGELVAPAGSHYVPLDQPLAHLAVAALEPDTQSSYFAHRLIGELDQLARVTAPPF